jgi:hypothetical protein
VVIEVVEELMVVAAPFSDVGVPLQDSMLLHHCIVSDPTLQKYKCL